MKHCPWCAAEVKPGSTQCPSCDREFGKSSHASGKSGKQSGMASRDAYQRGVPTWVFVLVVAICLIGIYLVFFGE